MTPTNIIEQLRRDEGVRSRGYKDSLGRWAIGIGHDIESGPPLSDVAIDAILASDLRYVVEALARDLPWSAALDPARRGVLLNLAFNLGVEGLLGFQKMLAAIQAADWDEAAHQLMSSKYAMQVGFRANRLALQLITGAWQ